MNVHLYALCWNEADMLEFFFRNYDPWVDRYFIFDDGSTDDSIEILEKHPKVELRQWNRSKPHSFHLSQLDWLNQVWKQSRGKADWIVIVDIDEHLFVPQSAMLNYLQQCTTQGVTIIPALGYQMISDMFPETGETLCQTITKGAPFKMMSKTSLFNPNAVEEINSSIGNHWAWPVGCLKIPDRDELLLLHYKYMDFDHTLKKHAILKIRKSRRGATNNFGNHYLWSSAILQEKWQQFENNSVDISSKSLSPHITHLYRRWWRPGWKFFIRHQLAHIISIIFGHFPRKLMRNLEQIIYKTFYKSKTEP